MTTIIRKTLFVTVAMTLVFVGLAKTTPAFAQDDKPPIDPDKEGEIVVTETLEGGSAIDGVLPGPGGQSAVLSSILSWYLDIFGWENVTGKGKVQVYGSPLPLARAWTTLLHDGAQEETTYPNGVCWTSRSNPCTSSTDHHLGKHDYWQNIAETDVYWNGGGSSHGSAIASKQF